MKVNMKYIKMKNNIELLNAIELLAAKRLKLIINARHQSMSDFPSFEPILFKIEESLMLNMTAIINIEWLSENITDVKPEMLNHVLYFLSIKPEFYPDLRKKLN